MPPLLTSETDLSDPLNIVQARHELRRALDSGDDAPLARWARRWGEAAMAIAETAEDMADLLEGGDDEEIED